MANSYFKQFMYSKEIMPVKLMGSFEQVGSTGVFATLVDNGITYLAQTMGSAGNSITIALVAGGTAGAEVVTVTGSAISVQIESGVSTRTQVKTAIDGSAAAAALVSVSVASGGTAATLLAATALATGADTSFTAVAKGFSVSQTGTGLFKIDLQDNYNALLSASIMMASPAAVDRTFQLYSVDVDSSTDPSLYFRALAGATPSNLADDYVLYIELTLRNSSY
jgi:hypothetical protein